MSASSAAGSTRPFSTSSDSSALTLRVRSEGTSWWSMSRLQLPNLTELENKSRQHGIAGNLARVVEAFDGLARTVDVDLLLERVHEPSQLRPVGDVFVHLSLQHPKPNGPPVARGHQFQYKLRTNRRDLLLLLIRKTVPTSVTDPGAIESAFGAVGEVEQSSRCKDNGLSRPFSPIRKAVVNPTVASARLPSRWSHNHQLLLGRELELKFAIIRTKLDKLFVSQADFFDV